MLFEELPVDPLRHDQLLHRVEGLIEERSPVVGADADRDVHGAASRFDSIGAQAPGIEPFRIASAMRPDRSRL